MSASRPLRKAFAELKRPDLKGEYVCVTCKQSFQHGASLNRHRASMHSDENTCLICDSLIAPADTVRAHMLREHGKSPLFTCGCCNWGFDTKKGMVEHIAEIRRFGKPVEVQPISISTHAPGSLAQAVQKNGKRGTSLSDSSRSSSQSPPIEQLAKKTLTPKKPTKSPVVAKRRTSRVAKVAKVTKVTLEETEEPEPVDSEAEHVVDARSKLSSLLDDPPYIESFFNALHFVLDSNVLTEQQLSDGYVWQEIFSTANKLDGSQH